MVVMTRQRRFLPDEITGDRRDLYEAITSGPRGRGPQSFALTDADGALRVASHGVLLDARAAERFRGEVEPVDPVAGHIPGAVNVPTGANLRDDGTFKSPEELREVYAAARDREVAAYCGSGVTAAHDLLAMAVAGIDGALYPGSWSAWVADRSPLMGRDLVGEPMPDDGHDQHPLAVRTPPAGPGVGFFDADGRSRTESLGERVLGLPAEPRVDKDMPYSQSPR